MSGDPVLLVAQAEADLARKRLMEGLAELRVRLSPSTIARDLTDTVTEKAGDAARLGADAVVGHKWAAAGVASLIGLVLARKPIAAILRDANETTTATARSGRHKHD